MPRSSRSSRPTARSAPASAPSGTRSSSTSATAPHPQQHAAPAGAGYGAGAQTQQRQPGMLANMASTMGGVAAGSVVGHGISNMLFGGSSRSEAPPPAELPAPVDSRMDQMNQQGWQGQQQGPSCGIEAKDFTKCLDATNDMQSCSYYLEALKACQSAAARY